MLTNRFDAEYGRVTGAVINAVSKSGTNQLRGSGLYFVRNDNSTRRISSPAAWRRSTRRRRASRSAVRSSKNRAHFFGAYEYQKRNVTARPNTGVPLFDVRHRRRHPSQAAERARRRAVVGQPSALRARRRSIT